MEEELDLLVQGQAAFELGRLEEAVACFQQAIQRQPENAAALARYADLLKHCNEFAKAKTFYLRAVEQPDCNYVVFFQLAELFGGEEAVDWYTRGICKLLAGCSADQLNRLPAELRRLAGAAGAGGKGREEDFWQHLSQACAAVAEIYQTDLLAERTSQERCWAFVQAALAVDAQNLEALFQLANYYANVEEADKARTTLDEVVGRLAALEEAEDFYTASFKLALASLCVELESFAQAEKLLAALHGADKSDCEVLYLLAFCCFRQGKFGEAETCLEAFFGENFQAAGEDLREAAEELREELGKRLGVATASGEALEDEWTDSADSADSAAETG